MNTIIFSVLVIFSGLAFFAGDIAEYFGKKKAAKAFHKSLAKEQAERAAFEKAKEERGTQY